MKLEFTGLARTALALSAGLLALGSAACGGGDEEAGSGTAGPRDRAFLSAMVPHHESAIEMARMAQERARRPEIRRVANGIIEAQEGELTRLRQIHRRLFDAPLEPDDRAHAELGLSAKEAGMTHGDMAALERARPFERAFIDAMIPHHAGAIQMARAVMAEEPDAEVAELADGIIRAQSQEIRELNGWRAEWYGRPSPAGGVPESLPPSGASGEHDGH